MNSIEWRKTDVLHEAASKLLNDEHMKIMLAIMRDESPINYPLPKVGSSADDKAMAYGIELGYQHCLRKLKSLGIPMSDVEPIESTFKNPQ